MPSLSVVMPNYNYANYIGEALSSVLGQSYKPDEIIVIDDASTDNSVQVVKSFMGSHSNIKLIQNAKNMGVVLSTINILKTVKGDYLHFMASDDKILPGLYERSMGMLSKYPEAGLCCSDLILFNDKRTKENRMFLSGKAGYFPPQETLKLFLKEKFSPVQSSTTIVKRKALLNAGGFRPELRWSIDAFAFDVVSFREGLCYVPEALTMVRSHLGQYGERRYKERGLEREIIAKMIALVRSPQYADVLPMFKQTAPFSTLPFEVLKVAISKRENWDFISPKLLKFVAYDLLTGFMSKIMPSSLYIRAREYYRNLLKKRGSI